jgi:hypothetical protein
MMVTLRIITLPAPSIRLNEKPTYAYHIIYIHTCICIYTYIGHHRTIHFFEQEADIRISHYIYIYIYMYTCIYMCIYIYIYIYMGHHRTINAFEWEANTCIVYNIHTYIYIYICICICIIVYSLLP